MLRGINAMLTGPTDLDVEWLKLCFLHGIFISGQRRL